ncbi:T9SS type A sorting domain-containing protein [Robertkochia aurantiaca]|uniref:T9SS type A sorting domain-containing protein n=1 Tax=Robertkochia aurantiaca TaxID=2873700 RepID=UPI001CCAF69A|nr:T9SS type A sorting domain-containing protein [Robertkochia sp. 3YJGBD-33]
MKTSLPFILLFLCCTPFWAQTPKFDAAKFFEEDRSVAVWNNLRVEKLTANDLLILPSGNYLRVKVPDSNRKTKIEIQDLLGITVLENKYDLDRDLDISTLREGNYIIKVYLDDRILMGKFRIVRT